MDDKRTEALARHCRAWSKDGRNTKKNIMKQNLEEANLSRKKEWTAGCNTVKETGNMVTSKSPRF